MTRDGSGLTDGDPPVFDICGDLPTGTTLLEASAGTGKTWTIAALVTRFVAEGHARLGEMLVVTFGRAASQELRERVRGQLVEAERALDDAVTGRCAPGSAPSSARAPAGGAPAGDRSLLAVLCDVAHDELVVRRDRLREALVDFDAATIATTHQFCQLVLRSLGVAGDTDSGARLVEDLDDLVVEVVDDLYLRGFARSSDDPAFDRRTAVAVARAAVGDPQARLEPAEEPHEQRAGRSGAQELSQLPVAVRRRRFADAVRTEMDVRKRRLGVLSYDDLLSRLADALEEPDAPARRRMRERWQVVLVDEFQDTDPVQWAVLDRAFSGHATMVLIGDPKQAIYAFRGGDVTTYLRAAATATCTATLGTNHRSDAALLRRMQTVLRGAALGDDRIVVRDVGAAHEEDRLSGQPAPAPFRLRLVDRMRFVPAPAQPGGPGAGRARAPRDVPIGALRAFVAGDLARDVVTLLASRPTFEGRVLQPSDVAVICETRKQCEVARAGLAEAGVAAVIAGGGSVFATEGADEWLTVLEAMEQPHRSARVRAAALTSFFGHVATDLDARGDGLTEEVADMLRRWTEVFRSRGLAAVFETACARGLPGRVLRHTGGERLMTDLRHVAESLHDTASREGLGLVALTTLARGRVADARSDTAGERTRRLDSDAAAVQILTVHGSKGLEYPVVYLPFVSDLWPRVPDFPLFHDDDAARCLDVGGPTSTPGNRDRAVTEDAGEDLRLLYVAMTRAQAQLVAWWLPSAKNTRTSSLHRMLFGRGPGDSVVPPDPPLPDDAAALARARAWEAAGGPAVEVIGAEEGAEELAPVSRGRLAARSFTRHVDQAWRRTSYSALSSAAAAADPVVSLGSEPEEVPKDDEQAIATTGASFGDASAAARGVVSPMAALPVGATFGSLVHAVLEHTEPADEGADLRAALAAQVRTQQARWPVAVDVEELAAALELVLETPLGPIADGATLRAIGLHGRMTELDFELPLAGGDGAGRPRDPRAGEDGAPGDAGPARLSQLAPLLRRHLPPGDPLMPYADVLESEGHDAQVLTGYLTGSIDVVLRVGDPDNPGDQRYVVVDYKTNWLGDPGQRDAGTPLTAWDYRPAALDDAMRHSSYPLQALLYAVVLHRFLRWRVTGYDPGRHLGGVVYLYLRGMCGPDTPVVDGQPCGVFAWRPPTALVEAVSDLLDGRSQEVEL